MTTLEIILLFTTILFFAIIIKMAAHLLKINEELDVNRVFEIIPKIKELNISNASNKLNKIILDNLSYLFPWIKSNWMLTDEVKKLMELMITMNADLEKQQDENNVLRTKYTREELARKTEIKKLNEKQWKELDEQNYLIKAWKIELKNVSKKLNKIVELVIKQNDDEDIEEMLNEFDAFYVINAAFVKWERIYWIQLETNKRQANIHKNSRNNHIKREVEYKKTYDRLRSLCTKYNEPIDSTHKRKKPKNNWHKK